MDNPIGFPINIIIYTKEMTQLINRDELGPRSWLMNTIDARLWRGGQTLESRIPHMLELIHFAAN